MILETPNWITYTVKLSDLALDKNEIYLNLGYGGQMPDEQFVEMIDQLLAQVADFCFPQTGFLILEGNIQDKNYLEINQTRIKVGSAIIKYLTHSTHFAVFIVTAGEAFDKYLEQLRNEGDVLLEFLVYSIGTEIAEATVRFVTDKINRKALQMGCKITQSYSPGHCSWHVREQQQLFTLFPDKPCGIELNDSSLMHPVKSISGIIGMGKEVEITPHGCGICGMVSCFKRKV